MSPNLTLAGVEAARRTLQHEYRPDEVERALDPYLRVVATKATSRLELQVLAEARILAATTARYRRQRARAKALAATALRLARRCGHAMTLALAHLEMAKVVLDHDGDPEPHLEAVLAAIHPSSDLHARVYYVRARAARRRGEFARAVKHLDDAIARLTPGSYHHTRYTAQLGLVQRLRGCRSAEGHLKTAVEAAEKGGFGRIRAFALLDLGQIALRRRMFVEAGRLLESAATQFEAVEDPIGKAHAHSALASAMRMAAQRQAPERAEESVRRAIDLLEDAICRLEGFDDEPSLALARRRLAQCFLELLPDASYDWDADPNYQKAMDQLGPAISAFERLGNDDGLALALAVLGRFQHRRGDLQGAVKSTGEAVRLLGKAAGQVRPGLEHLQFLRAHRWVYGFALTCAAESGDVEGALRIVATLRADTLGSKARQTLTREGGRVGELLRAICEAERGLRASGTDGVRQGGRAQARKRRDALLERRDTLFDEIDRELVALLTPPIERAPLRPGHYRLCVQLFDGVLKVQCDGPDGDGRAAGQTDLAPWARADIEALCLGEPERWRDGRPLRWERLGEVFLPPALESLRDRLVAGEVSVLEIEPLGELSGFPFGELRVGPRLESRRLDEAADVLLSPTELPGWLWRDDHHVVVVAPPAPGFPAPPSAADGGPDSPYGDSRHHAGASVTTVNDQFDAIVAGIGDLDEVRDWDWAVIMEIATGKHHIKSLHEGDRAVATRFQLAYERFRDEGLSPLRAASAAKRQHRERCVACSPAHVGRFIVAGRLDEELNNG